MEPRDRNICQRVNTLVKLHVAFRRLTFVSIKINVKRCILRSGRREFFGEIVILRRIEYIVTIKWALRVNVVLPCDRHSSLTMRLQLTCENA